MDKKRTKGMNDIDLAPADYISLMFERTDEDGILYIPGWHYDVEGAELDDELAKDESNSYRCRVDWNLKKYEELLKKFERHYELTEALAPYWDDLKTGERASSVLSSELYEFWSVYVRAFDSSGVDLERIADIEDRLDTMGLVKDIARKISLGSEAEDFEKQALAEYVGVSVSEEEKKYLSNYVNKKYKEAECRIGSNMCAYDVIIRTMRLCRLFNLDAPQMIIKNEARQLAAAMLLHDHGISRERVDNHIRDRLEREDGMSEEELDEIYRVKKSNSVKSLAPLFIYMILKEKTDSKKHMRLTQIEEELKKYPYELVIERKAIGRTVHNLVDTPSLAIYQDKSGVWMEQGKK